MARRALAQRARNVRSAWEPSRGLFALHSICVDRNDPLHIVVGVSAGGVYRSTDGGATWSTANTGVRAEHVPERYPAAGHNVHRVVMHPRDGRRLYRQCYNGTYRSDDGGATWTDITARVAERLRLRDCLRSGRCRRRAADPGSRVHTCASSSTGACGCSAATMRAAPGVPHRRGCRSSTRTSRYCATRWSPITPDRADIAFGTSSGHVFVTDNRGDDWRLVAEFLPRVTSLRFVATDRGVGSVSGSAALLDLLDARSGVVCAVGAGGKKSLLGHLATAHPGRVAITATVFTTYFKQQPGFAISHRGGRADSRAAVAALDPGLSVAYACPGTKPGRHAGVSAATIERIHREGGFAATLREGRWCAHAACQGAGGRRTRVAGLLHDGRTHPFRTR